MMENFDIPVVMIVFRRPELTKRVLAEVAKVRPPRLFVIADGPRKDLPEESELVQATREIFADIPWPCEVSRIYSETNLGLRNRVLTGLDIVFTEVDKAIVLEDDCLPSQDFFTFSREILHRYCGQTELSLVSGNNFGPNVSSKGTYFFSIHAHIWGWATWRRTWLEFRESKEIRELEKEDIADVLGKITGIFQKLSFKRLLVQSKNLDSWALQFSTFSYLNNLLSVVPDQNLVTNIGFGPDSTHTKFESWADEIPLGNLKFPLRHPEEIGPNWRQMNREARTKSLNWVRYPLLHPLDATKRIFRYLRTLAN